MVSNKRRQAFVLLHRTFLLQALIGQSLAFCPGSRLTRLVSPVSATTTEEPAIEDDAAIKDRLLLGLAKMNQVMTPQFFESSSILKPFYTKIVRNVEIKESKIPGAGLGLFAKKPIKASTIVSFYPAHALGIDRVSENSDGQSPSSTFLALDPCDREWFESNPSTKSSYLHCTDQPIFQRPSILAPEHQQEPVYLDVNPQRSIAPGWVSQMINDGATVQQNTEQGVMEYYRASKAAKNCIHIPFGPSPIMATVTTKKVKKGEELLTSYGGTYWLGVWLDVHGEEGVGITKEMKREIGESANDLKKCMNSASIVYANQLEALQAEFHKIVV